jgi:prepilin-type N-terminal cleavage/methylation domain-containing protein
MKMKDQRGFTLTELLIVIGIIVALAALIFPIARSAIGKARQVSCLGNLRQIGIGIESYLQDHNDTMPTIAAGRSNKQDESPVLETVLKEYLPNEEVFHCPEDKQDFAKSGSSYLWNSTQSGRNKLSLKFFGIVGDSSRIPLVTDKEAWHPGKQGVNILYADYSASKDVKFATTP